MKKSLFLTCFVMLCSLVFGQNRWTVNDALYENSMSLLAKVTVGNETAVNAEIAAFYDDEVRGVGKTDANGKVFLTIFGSDRERITFKIYDGEKVYASNYTVEFETNAANTSPVTVDFYEIHWNYEPNYDLYKSMTIVGKIHIDGVPQTGDNFELAVFYNDSLRSVARPDNGIVYLYIPGHGHENKPFEFKLYDGTRELVSDLRDLDVRFVNNKYDGTLDAPKPLNFITAPYVAQIGEVRYQSLASAFEAAQAGNVITMIDNVTEVVNITKTEAVTLDLASYTLTGSILAPNAKLTVENGNIINNDRNVSAIEINAGKLALNNVNISSARHAVRIDGAVTATINGGEYKLNATSGTRHAVNVSGAAKVTIKAGTFVGPKGTTMDSGSAVNVQSGATVTIEGGDFLGGKKATLGVSGTMILKGGTYDQDVTKYCAEGYICEFNTTKAKYEVIEGLKGKGTEAEPFIIKNLKDLTFFRNSVNAGETKYNAPGVWVALGANIDMKGVNWVGIGSATADHGFMGNFDGKTYKIQNLTITNPALDSDGYAYAGLFAVTEGTDKNNQNTIKNLTIENVTINTTGDIVSAAIAYPYYTIVDNVKVCGDIKIQGGKYTAGVLAYTRRCVNASKLSIVGNDGSYVKGTQTVGGVISDIQMNGGLTAVYSNFSAEGITVTGEKSVGGIAGIIATQTLNGATVKNVALSSQDAFAGVVAGRLGGTSTISNVVAENVIGATAVIGATYDGAKAVEARIGDTYYGTFAAALEAAQAGEEITLLTNITSSDIITLNKAITLDGNSKKLTSTANRAINVDYNGNVNISNLTIATTNNTERAINVIQKAANLTLTDVKAEGFKYTINVASSSVGSTITTNGGKFSGYAAVNITGSKTSFTSTNTEFIGINNASLHESNNYGVIVVNAAPTENVNVNINGGKVVAQTTVNRQFIVDAENAKDANITINAELELANGYVLNAAIENGLVVKVKAEDEYVAALNAQGYATSTPENGLVTVLGKAVASIGETLYASLKAALEAVKDGDNTIELLADCAEKVTITQVNSTNIVINGNGKTYTGTITIKGDKVANNLYNTETLTFKNINFTPAYNTYAITAEKNTYARNITVDGCTFKGNNDVYGIRVRNGYNYTVKNTTVEGVYTFFNASEALVGLTVENVTVKCANVAFAGAYGFGNASFKEVTIESENNGVKVNNPNSSSLTFENCLITAKTPVTFLESAGVTSALTAEFNGTNTMVVNNGGTYWFDIIEAEATDATFKAIVNDADLDMSNTAFVASIGNVYYNKLQKAIDAAVDGNTVTMAKDIELDAANCVTNSDGYSVFVNVAGKAVTIDLNGKAVTANLSASQFASAKSSLLMAVFSVDTNGNLTLNDSKGTGKVAVTANDASVYSLISNYDSSAKLTINGGSYELDKARAKSSLIHSDPSEAVVVNGGNFYLGNVNTGENGSPWIFNVNGNNTGHVTVNGGTFNYDINHQHWAFEVHVDKKSALQNNGNGTWTVVPAVAYVEEKIGDYTREVGYATLEEALASEYGNVVTLLKDVEMEEILVLDKAVNLNGAGYTLSSKAERAINVATEGEVNISDLTIATTNNTERAINVIQKAANLTLTDVKAEGFKYTINVASSSVGSTINTIRGKFSGYAAVNITGSKTTFNSEGTELIGINNASLHESNNYGVIVVNAAPTENVNVNINGGKVVAKTTVNRQFIVDAENAKDANITINAELELANGDVLNAAIENGLVVKVKAEYADELLAQGYVSSAADTNGLVTVLGVKVAQVEDTYYATLQDAIDAADGKTVVVLTDIDLTEGVTVAAGKVVTLDLNDNTVTGTPTEAKAYAVIANNGNLTIKNGSIICDHKLAGSTGYAVNAITNGGTLTIDGATVLNKSTAQYQIGYAIDNNSTTGNAVVVVKSGAVRASGSNYYDGIRQFCNSLTNENSVTIEGGEVSTLWMQNPSDGAEKNTKDVKGSFSITGGKVGVVSTEPSANFTASITAGEITKVEHFQTAADRDLVGYITGGTFGMDVTEPFCHEDYSAIPQANNTWVVEQTAGTLTRTLINGWSWFSSYINIEGSYGFGLLTDALGASAEQIKEGKNGQGLFAQYSQTSGWYGQLSTASSKMMYQIKTIEDVEVNIHGKFFDVKEYKPILRKGWNYLSYPHTKKLDIATALQGFSPVDNDLIKTLDGSMMYWEDANLWIASGITELVPGVGYMYQSNDPKTKQVSYTTVATRSAAKAYVSESPEHWTVGLAQYPNNMTMIATLDVEGGDYEVAAFVNGELRGSVRPIYIEELNQYIMVMTILGEEVADVTFKYYDFNTEEEYDLNNVVVYSDNAVLGSVEEPYTLTRGTTGIGEATLSDINIYPNPTTTDREINLQAICDKVEVFNTLGVKVAEYQNVDTIDALETAGTYVIRVTLNGDVKHCRLVVK